MFTTNFALTYYTVASDIESSKLNAYLIVVETEGSQSTAESQDEN